MVQRVTSDTGQLGNRRTLFYIQVVPAGHGHQRQIYLEFQRHDYDQPGGCQTQRFPFYGIDGGFASMPAVRIGQAATIIFQSPNQ